MLELSLLVGFVVYGILCYHIGRMVKQDEINKERINNLHRADSIINRVGDKLDRMHKEGKL